MTDNGKFRGWIETSRGYANEVRCGDDYNLELIVERDFNDYRFSDEFDKFVEQEVLDFRLRKDFIENFGDLRNMYDDLKEKFIKSVVSKVFVEGKDAIYMGVTYHWFEADLGDMDYIDYIEAHDDEICRMFYTDEVIKTPKVGMIFSANGNNYLIAEGCPGFEVDLGYAYPFRLYKCCGCEGKDIYTARKR